MRRAVSWSRLLLSLAAGLVAGLAIWIPVGFAVWLTMIEPAVEQSYVDLGILHFEGESSGEPFRAGNDALVGAAVFYASLLVVVALGVWLALMLIGRARTRPLVVIAAIVAADLIGIELVGRASSLAGLAVALLIPVLVLRRETRVRPAPA